MEPARTQATPGHPAPAGPPETPVERASRVACELVLVAMVLLTASEVVLRGATGRSLEFADEVGGYLLAALTFLSLSVALAGGAFHRVEFLLRRLPARSQALAEVVFTLLALAFTAVLEWQIGRLVYRSYTANVEAPTMLATPLWIPQSAMLVGCATLILSLLHVLWCSVRRTRAALPQGRP